MSAVAGYVDAAGFLALFGLLTAHVTGDLVTAGAIFADGVRLGAGARLAMIPIFMGSVASTAIVARAIRRRGDTPLVALLALMTLALAAFCATGVALRPSTRDPGEWSVVLTGATGVVAMGVQNALMRDALSGLCPTTIMTGNLTQFTMDLVEIVLPAPVRDAARFRSEVGRRLFKFGMPVFAFLLGAIMGGAITTAIGLWSIALPTTSVAALTIVVWRRSRRQARLGG